jgi:hypothetical protein
VNAAAHIETAPRPRKEAKVHMIREKGFATGKVRLLCEPYLYTDLERKVSSAWHDVTCGKCLALRGKRGGVDQ